MFFSTRFAMLEFAGPNLVVHKFPNKIEIHTKDAHKCKKYDSLR